MTYIVLISMLVLFLMLLSLKTLQDLISELDLKPSLTQFLMVAIFTPILLISMQFYSKYEEEQKNLHNDMLLTSVKIVEMKSKIRDVNSTINVLQTWSKDREITNKTIFKLNRQLDDLNNGLTDYISIYNKMMSYESSNLIVKQYAMDFDKQQVILKSIIDLTSPQQSKLSSFDIFRVDQFYKIFLEHFVLINQNQLKEYYEFENKIINQNKIQIIFSSIINSFAIFLIVIILLKAIYVEKILLHKLNKIKDKSWINDNEKIILIKIENILEQRIQNKTLSIKYFFSNLFNIIMLLRLDKKLNSIIDAYERNIGNQICKSILELDVDSDQRKIGQATFKHIS